MGDGLNDTAALSSRRQRGADPLSFEEEKEKGEKDSSEYVQEDHAIVSIQIDPTNLILACSYGGQVLALTPFESRHNYMYIEFGEEIFCTVGLPSTRAREIHTDTVDLN